MDRTLLVIGYGNTLRRDDGVGPKAAAAIDDLGLSDVITMAYPQLTPELADPVSRAAAVLFVDAEIDYPGELRLRRIEPSDCSQILAHAADPSVLLALARDAFGRSPEAWMLTIPAEALGFGEELSPTALRGVGHAVETFRELHRKLRERGVVGPQDVACEAGTARPHVHVRA